MTAHGAGAEGIGHDAQRQRMQLAHAALAHDGGRHRQGELFLQGGQGLAGGGEVHAAAGDDHRITAVQQRLCHILDGVPARHDPVERVMAQAGRARGRRGGQIEHVVGDEQHRRAGTARAGGGKGLIHIGFHAFGRGHAARPLGAGGKEPDVIELLEGVPVLVLQRDLLQQHDQRDGGLERFGGSGDHQRGGRAVLGDHDAGALADAGIPVRHVAAAILGPVGDLAKPQLFKGDAQALRQSLAEEFMDAVTEQHLADAVAYAVHAGCVFHG